MAATAASPAASPTRPPPRFTHLQGRVLGESWVRGRPEQLPNHGASLPSGSLSHVLDVTTPERQPVAVPSAEKSPQQLLGAMSLGAQPSISPGWLPPVERERAAALAAGAELPEQGEFGAVLVQSAGAELLGEEQHAELLGEMPPMGEIAKFQFLSRLDKFEAKKLLRS